MTPTIWRHAVRLATDLPKSTSGRRYMAAAYWSAIGTLGPRAIGLVAAVLSARILGQTAFGELGAANNTLGMLATFAGFGLALAGTKRMAELRDTDPTRARTQAQFILVVSMASYALTAIGVFAVAKVIASSTLNAPHLTGSVRILAAVLLVSGVDAIQVGILSGFEAFDAVARSAVLRSLLVLPLTYLGAVLFGLEGIICANLLASCSSAVYNARSLSQRGVAPRLSSFTALTRQELRNLASLSFSTHMIAVLTVPVTWVVTIIVIRRTDGYQDLAVLNAIGQWRQVAIIVPAVVSTASVAIQSSLYGQSDLRRFAAISKYNLVLHGLGTALAAILVAFGSRYLLSAYGDGFAEGGLAFAIMAVSWIPMALSSALSNSLISADSSWSALVGNATGAIALVLLVLKLSDLGVNGVAVSYLLSYSATFVALGIFYVSRFRPRSHPFAAA